MYGLDLFSGIGGITKALEGYVRPVAYCENDRYAQSVLLSRMSTGDLPIAPIWDDVRTLNSKSIPYPEIIYGGFPCQDISIARRIHKGLHGEQSGLFFEMARLVGEIRPKFVFVENVTAISVSDIQRIVGTFRTLGYGSRGLPLCASEIGCPMHGHRWFVLAAADSDGLETSCDSQNIGENEEQRSYPKPLLQVRKGLWSDSPSRFVGMDYGVPYWVDRIKCLGNAVV